MISNYTFYISQFVLTGKQEGRGRTVFLIMRWEKGMVSIYELGKPRPRTKYTIQALELFRPLLSRPVLKPGLMAPAKSPGSFVLHFLGCILDPSIHVKKMESWSLGVTLI